MARLRGELLERTEVFAHRMVDLAEALEKQRRSNRIVDQITGAGTSVGANTAEADEATSRKEFTKFIGIVLRELAESRFWVRFVTRRAWFPPKRLLALEEEASELKRIFGSMTARIRRQERGE